MPESPFGDLLRRHRERAGLTQEELAERAGLTVNGVGQLERGERRHPYPHTVRALIDALRLNDEAASELRAAVVRRRRRGEPTVSPPAGDPPQQAAAAVPMPRTPRLIGRDADVSALASLLERGRIVTITGPGGVGKTTVAVAVATATRSPVVFVPLAAVTDPALVLPAVAGVLGVRESDRSLEDSLVDALRATDPILVLDNLEHVLDAAPAIARLVERSDAVTLATSRAPLRVRAEVIHALAPLPVPATTATPIDEITAAPAAALLIERARAQAPGFAVASDDEAEAVREICRRLDGLPLAIELAAGWLRLLRPRDLLDRLDRTLPMLAHGARDLPERQQTLRSAIEWSEALLEADARTALRRLAALGSPWDLALAAAAAGDAGTDAPAALSAVAALEEASLLVAARGKGAGPAFAMLETIREYGLDRLEAAGETAGTRDRIARHVVATAKRSSAAIQGPDQAAALRELDRALPNLRETFEWLLGAGRPDEAAALGLDVVWFWFIRGHLTEGRRLMERVLASSPTIGAATRMRALAVLGVLTWQQGDAPRALEALDEAADLAGRAGDRQVLAVALLGRTWARLAVGELDAADEDAQTFEVVATDGSARAAVGLALAVRVHVLAARGRLDEAATELDRVERLLREAGGPWGIAFALNMRAMVVQLVESDAAALPIVRESIPLSRSIDDLLALFYGVTSLAGALVASEPERAARVFGAAEALGERLGLVLSNPSSIALYERQTTELSARLDETTLDRLWSEGRAADLDALLADPPAT